MYDLIKRLIGKITPLGYLTLDIVFIVMLGTILAGIVNILWNRFADSNYVGVVLVFCALSIVGTITFALAYIGKKYGE